jgi:alpha-glucan,water dikinase
MHRANLCRDLLGEALQLPAEAKEATLCALYVWMRYSAVRALTWQRNYNTQPRQLSGAQVIVPELFPNCFELVRIVSNSNSRAAGEGPQDAMSKAVASAYGSAATPAERWYTKAILGCGGRGGDGQRIRDDILHIMHRHNIKEVKGTWMEQWHQKLHNNTTPDDIVICEAYLAFLRNHGDNGVCLRTLPAT